MFQSDDIVSIKQWDIYILLDLYYNGAPGLIITVIECVSELISPRRDNARWLFQQLNLTDGLTGLIVSFLVVNANYLIKEAFYKKKLQKHIIHYDITY